MGLSALVKSLYKSYAGGTLGTRVFRVADVAGTPPMNVWRDIFTVANGLVLMTMLIGERTIAQGGGASNLDIQSDPTAAGASVAICAPTVVTADAVGTLYTFTGVPTDGCYAAVGGVPGGMAGGLAAQGFHGWVIPPGTIEWRESLAAAATGAIQWTMFYVPIDPEATVAFA